MERWNDVWKLTGFPGVRRRHREAVFAPLGPRPRPRPVNPFSTSARSSSLLRVQSEISRCDHFSPISNAITMILLSLQRTRCRFCQSSGRGAAINLKASAPDETVHKTPRVPHPKVKVGERHGTKSKPREFKMATRANFKIDSFDN